MWWRLPNRLGSDLLRGRAARATTAVAGAGLLIVAVTSGVQGGRDASQATLDRSLQLRAPANAAALHEYFGRAQSINLLLAHEPSFRELEPGRRTTPEERARAVREAGAAMAYLEELYPGRISEACLIDATGTEIVRVVQGQVAPDSELSTEEATASFFAPTLRLPTGRVHQAAPYVSEDTGDWVISNATPMRDTSNKAWGLLHFEVTLKSFSPAMSVGVTQEEARVWIVDVSTGRIVLRDGTPVVGDATGEMLPTGVEALLDDGEDPATTVDGRRFVLSRVPTGPDNANSWAVVVSAPVAALG